MRQPGSSNHNSSSEAAMSSKDLLLHSIKEEDSDARGHHSRGGSAVGCIELSASGSRINAGHRQSKSLNGVASSGVLELLTKGPLHPATAAKLQGLVAARSSETAAAAEEEGDGPSGAPVDIGLKVANEIIGLHSQAAAAGRALAHTTRHAELMAEENKRLKDDMKKAQQARCALEDELTRIKSKLSQRSIEMLMQEQKVQAAEELAEANGKKAAEAEANTTATNERYDALVMRVMVVAVKAAVAADDLEKALNNVQAMRAMGCGCKPALLHGIEVLSAMVSFRDTWRAGPGTPRGSSKPSAGSSVAQRAAAAAAAASTTATAAAAGSQSPRALLSPRSIGRSMLGKPRDSPAGSKATTNKPGWVSRPSSTSEASRSAFLRASSAGDASRKQGFSRPGSAGNISRQSFSRPGSAGDISRQSFARPSSAGERRLTETFRTSVVRPSSACEVRSAFAVSRTNQQMASLEQQLQRLQEQRHAQCTYPPPVRRTSRSRSVCSSREASPERGRNLAGVPSTDSLRAAANQMLSAIAQQRQQMRPSTGSGDSATVPRVGSSSTRRMSSSSVASMPATARRMSSSASPPPSWNSGPGSHKRHGVSSANPSRSTSPRRATYDDGDTVGYYGSSSQQSYRAYADIMCDPRESEPQYEPEAVQYSRRVYQGGVLYTS